MFDVSFPEFVLVAVIGLLVLGPQKLPKVAAEIGKWVGRARRTAAELRRQLEREIELNDIQPPAPAPTESSGSSAHTGQSPPADGSASPPDAAPTPTAQPLSPAEYTPPEAL